MRYYTTRDAECCKRGEFCGSGRDSFSASDKRIRENINNFENLRLQKSWTLKDSVGSSWNPKNTPVCCTIQGSKQLSPCCLYQRLVIWTAWAYGMREGIQKWGCGQCPGKGLPCLVMRMQMLVEGNTSALGFQAQLRPAKLLPHCWGWGCRWELQGVWFADFGAKCICFYSKTCCKFSIRSLSLKILH